MGEFDGRLVMLLLWGGGTLLAYGKVFANRLGSWRLHRDKRSRRDLVESIGFLLVAGASALSIALLLFGPVGTGVRGWAAAVALGAYLAVGIFMAQERPREDERA